jgi:hypothetical protein
MHINILYIGSETREEYKRELSNVITIVNELISGRTISVNDIEYSIEPILVCDLVALVKILGLYNVFHPKSKWKCPWCLVCADSIWDFEKPHWELRKYEEMQKLWEEVKTKTEAAKKKFANIHYGITGRPLFNFLMDHVIPCMMHCQMGITRKLLSLLAEETIET